MRYPRFDHAFFSANRQRFMRKMQPDSIAIFQSNDLMPRSGDTFFPFRQNSGLFYLSGLDQEESVVVLFPDCVKEGFNEIAFIKRTNEQIATWEGHKLTKEEACDISGISKVYWLDEMEGILRELIILAKRIYINTNEHERFMTEVPDRNLRFARHLKQQFPGHKFHRAQPILRKLMMIKSRPEIERIQEAVRITHNAFQRVLGFTKPGVKEYEIEAEVTHEFIRSGCSGHAYDPILASGKNNCVLHYIRNDQVCQDGDLLLMDFGAEYSNYAADLSRTIPVNGRYSQRQRQVYDGVLKIFYAARQLLVPGTTLQEFHREVGKITESILVELGLLDKTDIKGQSDEQPAYKKFLMHGVAHHLGLDVHDLSNRYNPLQAGMIFTCEPGIYLPEEGFGIRIENDILITDDGPVDLMANIPIEAEEIETLMNAEVMSN